MKYLFSLVLLTITGLASASVDNARFLQLIDYIGVDYPAAVQNGEIISADEYNEMSEFAATVLEQARELDATTPRAGLTAQAEQLQRLVAERADPAQVTSTTATLRKAVLDNFKIQATPRAAPDLRSARALFSSQCASCHGVEGMGDGPLARGMEPAPTNFHDVARYRDRTLYGLYSTISIGVEGTGMQGYAATLSEAERWSLAFFVGQLAAATDLAEQGSETWSTSRITALADLKNVTTVTPAEAEQRFGNDGLAQMAFLRHNPEALFKDKAPLAFARTQTELSQRTYAQGNTELAYQQALSAYLDGFELAEHGVDAVDHELRLDIEAAMSNYRELIKHSAEPDAVQEQATRVLSLLDRAAEAVRSKSLSTGAAFSGAFIILVREGLEALLVVAALAAFLIKTDRRDGLLYLHFGWAGALLLGIATWLGSQYLFDFSGANREITEGLAALIAMLVLFYVGFWLHSKTAAAQWKRFIEDSVNKALDSGTMWAIAGLSFIAVYREVFETILFYQAMWVQAENNAQASLIGGVATGAAVLFVLAWLILRYSARLPLRQFFSYTSIFMFVLAIVFAGKGIAALQEAGKIPFNPVNLPSIDILGIYPNIEGLVLQGILLVLAIVVLFSTKRKANISPSS
jgi:high-affinity iron transporter